MHTLPSVISCREVVLKERLTKSLKRSERVVIRTLGYTSRSVPQIKRDRLNNIRQEALHVGVVDISELGHSSRFNCLGQAQTAQFEYLQQVRPTSECRMWSKKTHNIWDKLFSFLGHRKSYAQVVHKDMYSSRYKERLSPETQVLPNLPASGGFENVLTAMDVISRYLFAYHLSEATAINVAKMIIDIITKHCYLPTTLITDKGTAFISTINSKNREKRNSIK